MAGRKRARQVEEDDPPQQAQQEPAARRPVDRRLEMADIARRRAQHFATFQDDDEVGEGNVHAGGNEARTLGPWSSAVELVNAREDAAAARQRKLAGQGGEEAPRDVVAKPVVEWVPRRDPKEGPRAPCPVASLFDACAALLVAHIECIDSLAGVPDVIRARLARAVCATRKMDAAAALLFARDATSEVVLPDCTQLDAAALEAAVVEAATPRLELLELGFCGRGFGDATAAALARAARALPPSPPLQQPILPQGTGIGSLGDIRRNGDKAAGAGVSVLGDEQQGGLGNTCQVPGAGKQATCGLSSGGGGSKPGSCGTTSGGGEGSNSSGALWGLRRLSLGGAYRLNDSGLESVLAVAPGLEVLAVTQAPRLVGCVLPRLATLVPHLRQLDLSDCRGIPAAALCDHLPQLPHLTRISLDGCTEVNDTVMATLAHKCSSLSHLSLCLCPGVTDKGMGELAAGRGRQLRGLRLDRCEKLTDQGLAALAQGCKELKSLSMRRLLRLSAEGVCGVVGNGGLEWLAVSGISGVDDSVMAALAASCRDSLTYLDLSFCRHVSDVGLGLVADSCARLEQLLVFGCSQLTDTFVHGHSNTALAEGGGVVGLGTGVMGSGV